MGYIKLIIPVVHIWYLKNIPNLIPLLLGIKKKTLEEKIYFTINENISKENKLGAEYIKKDLEKLDLQFELNKTLEEFIKLNTSFNSIRGLNLIKHDQYVKRIRFLVNFMLIDAKPE